jgi:diketogulonate reductase-like aldo/keto reductase
MQIRGQTVFIVPARRRLGSGCFGLWRSRATGEGEERKEESNQSKKVEFFHVADRLATGMPSRFSRQKVRLHRRSDSKSETPRFRFRNKPLPWRLMKSISRRRAIRWMTATAAGLCGPRFSVDAQSKAMLMRAIPASDEKLPAIGLGTWQAFDVGDSPAAREPLEEVLRSFVKFGGKLIDSSPMYGRAESVIGDLTAKLGLRDSLFLATKVWTTGKAAGIESMERSAQRLKAKRIDLMQVHNLVDVETQLATLRDWKAQDRIRYLGITHYNSSAYAEVEKVLRREKLDFLQINYSLGESEAEDRILPLAQERGVAVIVNRPLGGGDLFGRVRSKALPEWAAEFDCKSWAQFFLKWIMAHPAVTCAIPATSNPRHLEDNMQAGYGRLPDANMRKRMAEIISGM